MICRREFNKKTDELGVLWGTRVVYAVWRGWWSVASEEEVSSFDEVFHFSVGDRAFVHPEAAVGVDRFDAVGAEDLSGFFDAVGDEVGGFDGVGLDVDDA